MTKTTDRRIIVGGVEAKPGSWAVALVKSLHDVPMWMMRKKGGRRRIYVLSYYNSRPANGR